MPVALVSVAFLVALLCAGLMGYAIQSGATCTVYAVAELIDRRRATRLIAMLEAGLWVALVMTLTSLLHWPRSAPVAHAISLGTVAGGVLLGLGATVNGACLFGSVARFGSGEVGFAAVLPGYLGGIVGHDRLFGAEAPTLPWDATAGWHMPGVLVLGFGGYAGLRTLRTIYWTVRSATAERRPHLWNPHEATLVIGVTFAILMLDVGAWTYSDLLADLAHGSRADAGWRLILFAALLGGARLAGQRHGWSPWIAPSARQLLASFAGGALMGLGGGLIPGGNDGLVLVGLPFLLPYAWLALASMALTIALVLWLQRHLASRL
ncbi:YeeE/YedE thiosulfate transporter family protein [Novosphingobium piscinae]|uniref:YeeE/YedE family protein n=1 Tax=Novosphingobium piscinae TaxID=1507448 RepID=A0A7X1FZC7_9SPHN|nr:YeeE/YedE thiosulfate transporter family protein [Novosphingobium piscinae]MBC2669775.1 YeeE/YedE family protein [Novosphingobium piscinae]